MSSKSIRMQRITLVIAVLVEFGVSTPELIAELIVDRLFGAEPR